MAVLIPLLLAAAALSAVTALCMTYAAARWQLDIGPGLRFWAIAATAVLALFNGIVGLIILLNLFGDPGMFAASLLLAAAAIVLTLGEAAFVVGYVSLIRALARVATELGERAKEQDALAQEAQAE
jgi:hypothetical protein